ncbi:MAG: S-adenosylmethionine decarboxylase [Nanoarchaeota archaeon]
MKDIEPNICRQRVTIEARYSPNTQITEEKIKDFLIEFAKELEMSLLIKPLIFSPNKINHPIHHGIAGFVAWATSGCSVYTWDKFNFLTVETYTCKPFDKKKAVEFVKRFFDCTEIEFSEVKHD